MIVDCCRHIHASTAGDTEVGLVEGHESGGAAIDGDLSCGGPLGQETRIVTVEQGDKLEGGVEVAVVHARTAAGSVKPVVGPGDLAVLTTQRERHGEVSLIVR
jgi:hypothetical protein